MRRIARSSDGSALVGDEEGFVPLATADPSLTDDRDALRAATDGLPDPTDASSSRLPADHISFDVPIATARKLLGIGLNYVDHADDLEARRPDEPASFFKPETALTGPGSPIRLPSPELTDRVTAEAELAVVVGRECRDVGVDEVPEVVAGYVPVIDMTAEDILQRNPRFLTRAKSFDTFLVMGPWITVTDGDLDGVEVRTVVNGEVTARDTVSNMQFPPRELVALQSEVMTLRPGDVISTGTPGAAPISPGDTVRAEVDRVGEVEADVVGHHDG